MRINIKDLLCVFLFVSSRSTIFQLCGWRFYGGSNIFGGQNVAISSVFGLWYCEDGYSIWLLISNMLSRLFENM